ncbi:hypothetical protein RN001_007221 [Aquatica leii]|uniref:Exonuclease domain-containing protein n=1 Tax=Aquatica leii TaxID=1421715 RepID=A0AAN7SQU5_9COLE|nr:hypothetical protein RN001_007221 [Aquatica leii]
MEANRGWVKQGMSERNLQVEYKEWFNRECEAKRGKVLLNVIITLLTMAAEETVSPDTNNISLEELSLNIDFGNTNQALVFFDLETSGFMGDCDVLQIAARHENTSFSKYIEPNEPIPESASIVNGLTNQGPDMFLYGEKVQSFPLRIVLEEFLQFLINCDKKCVLIAHNCAFDARVLVTIINEVSLKDEFSNVIDSFVDTLPLFRQKFPGAVCKLGALADKCFSVSSQKMHDATYDVLLLQNLVFKHFTLNELLSKVKNFVKTINFSQNLKSLRPLETCVSQPIRKRMAYEGITYDNILSMHSLGEEKVVELLEKPDSDGKKVIRTKKIMNAILNYLKNLNT